MPKYVKKSITIRDWQDRALKQISQSEGPVESNLIRIGLMLLFKEIGGGKNLQQIVREINAAPVPIRDMMIKAGVEMDGIRLSEGDLSEYLLIPLAAFKSED